MIIYGAFLIPLITAIILFVWYKHKAVWWELAVPVIVSAILIFVAKWTIEVSQVRCTEYYGSFIKRVEYYEEWNEYIHRTCTRSCGKNCTTTYDCSYVQYHAPYWQIITTTNEVVGISESQYLSIRKQFGNEEFIELGRNYYTNDGDEYLSQWPQDSTTSIPVTTLHSYENRVKASDESVFHFQKVADADVQKFALKGYPGIKQNYSQDAVVGYTGKDVDIVNKKFQYINGLLGHKKEVRVFVLVFEGQSYDAYMYQEWLWSGSNMNEFVICIGTDKQHNVKWSHVLSWTTNELLKVKVKDFVNSQTKIDLHALAYFTQKEIDKGFVRRDFHEFDYLTVDPPTWAVILVYLLTIGVNIGVSRWVITNEFEE